MSLQSKRELLYQVAPRYRESDRRQKSVILNEFVATTGYARKYAIRLLTSPVDPLRRGNRPRARWYGAAVQEALAVTWAAANYICGKRLVPFLPELIPVMERHGYLALTNEVREQLLAVSPATADRLLRPYRQKVSPRGIGTTRSGPLLKHQVPVRTFADWTENEPGFMEADLVAHCGHRAEGAFLYTLVLTDIATGWTECLPLLYRTQEAVIQALGRTRQLLPMRLLGLDTDNGSEFLNAEVIGYCEQEQITFTRGRAYKKNDQCYVEQKNGSIVRQLVGYDRFEGVSAYQQLNELYRAVRLYVNFFQPSMKLRSKQREGSRVRRSYDVAQTPFQRLVASGVLSQATHEHLQAIYAALDPVRLLMQLQALQDALWQHAEAMSSSPQSSVETVRFHAGEPIANGNDRHVGGMALTPRERKYRHTPKPRTPRTWRTRPDPFESVWDEITQWLEERPDLTAKSVLSRLRQRNPGQYPDNQLRTLQRRVREWRARALLQFDDQWLSEEVLVGTVLPNPLRAAVARDSEPVLRDPAAGVTT